MSTAAAGADSTGEGATQIKFVTRSGTNQFHGGLFETNRNSYFEANYYFNGINGLKRDFLNLNVRLPHRRPDQEEQAVLL